MYHQPSSRCCLTELRESNELAAILASFIDPVDGFLDGKLKVEPTRLGVDGGSLVLGEKRGHFGWR